jgi:hypothetical protein
MLEFIVSDGLLKRSDSSLGVTDGVSIGCCSIVCGLREPIGLLEKRIAGLRKARSNLENTV